MVQDRLNDYPEGFLGSRKPKKATSLAEEVCSNAKLLAAEINSDVLAPSSEIEAAIDRGFRIHYERGKQEGIELLGSAIKKFAPDLAATIVERYHAAVAGPIDAFSLALQEEETPVEGR